MENLTPMIVDTARVSEILASMGLQPKTGATQSGGSHLVLLAPTRALLFLRVRGQVERALTRCILICATVNTLRDRIVTWGKFS